MVKIIESENNFKYVVNGKWAYYPLSGDHADGLLFVLSNNCIDIALKYKWYLSKNGYAVNSRGKYFHKIIRPTWDIVDHKNGNKLDNRICNLRKADYKKNNRGMKARRKDSKQPYRGVKQTPIGKWQARITKDEKCFYLGTFETPEEAALAYNEKAIELFGEFLQLNEVQNGK